MLLHLAEILHIDGYPDGYSIMNSQFAEILQINGYQMAMCAEPLDDYFAQAIREPEFQPDRGRSRGYQGTWEIQDGRLYLIELSARLNDGSDANIATFFPERPNRVFAYWYSGPLVAPDINRTKYIPGPQCLYDCDLFVTIDKGVVAEAYLNRAGGPKDYAAAAERYGSSRSTCCSAAGYDEG